MHFSVCSRWYAVQCLPKHSSTWRVIIWPSPTLHWMRCLWVAQHISIWKLWPSLKLKIYIYFKNFIRFDWNILTTFNEYKLLYFLANSGLGYACVFGRAWPMATLWCGHPKTQGVDLPKDISSGMQHQMDLMENTFLLFRVFALSFSILQRRALVHTFDPVPSISPALPVTLTYAHTPPNFPFVCFCGMFAFLSSLSQCVLGEAC